MNVDKPNDRVTGHQAEDAVSETGSRAMIVGRIKQALVTSRLTLGSQSTGSDPYDTQSVAVPGAVWSDRAR